MMRRWLQREMRRRAHAESLSVGDWITETIAIIVGAVGSFVIVILIALGIVK